jgi:hypothetical protein
VAPYDVPPIDGVPSILRTAEAAANTVGLMTIDLLSIASLNDTSRQWDLLDDGGDPVFGDAIDTMIGIDYRRSATICDYPVEQGGFSSYNKVQRPIDVRIEVSKAGSQAEIDAMQAIVEGLYESLDAFSLLMPSGIVESMNVVAYRFSRDRNSGPQRLTVQIDLQEIRLSGQTTYTNAKEPSGADVTNSGAVQPQTPSSAQAQSLTEAK